MSATDRLVAHLAADLTPVAPLPHPLLRAGVWFLAAVSVGALAVLIAGLRPGIADHLARPPALLEWLSAIATALLAAAAAFLVAVPGRSAAWALLPAPALGLWLASIGWGCVSDWVRFGPEGLVPGASLGCLASIVLISLPTGGLMLWMLRHAARVRPTATVALGMLATSGLASAALTLFHHLDAAVMVLTWHGGTVAVLVLLASASSRRLFRLVASRRARAEAPAS